MNKNNKEFWSGGLTVDAVIFTVDDGKLKVLLINRSQQPFKGNWTLPGGFLKKGEELPLAAARVLKDKTGVRDAYLEQLYTFDKKGRDPRGQIVTVVYFALAPGDKIQKFIDTKEANLFSVNRLPKLGFDHGKIIKYAAERLRYKLEYTNIVFSLLPQYFTLGQLQKVYEAILGIRLDKRNFLKKFLSLSLIKPTKKVFSSGRQRPARLYQFVSNKPQTLKKFF